MVYKEKWNLSDSFPSVRVSRLLPPCVGRSPSIFTFFFFYKKIQDKKMALVDHFRGGGWWKK